MDDWTYWTLTSILIVVFVFQLTNFNRPWQKLVMQIENMELRHSEMQSRLSRDNDELEALQERLNIVEQEIEKLEATREDMQLEFNKRFMVEIPAGTFTMGGWDEDSPRTELPAHKVQQSAYYIGKTPVTNLEYRDFVKCTGAAAPIDWQLGTFRNGTGKHPVVNVSWQEARVYAEWRGARLPSESEWEKAARGTDERPYPWGTRFTEGERCNATNQVGTTTPVDEWPDGRSFYGLWDMAGNVYEWCEDYYDPDYYKESSLADPKGPEGGQERVIRGGCFNETRTALRTTHRASSAEVISRSNIGFRLAMDAGNV